MEALLYEKLKQTPKMYELLKHNSYYIKYLNRDANFYKTFIKEMKEKYKLRATDKVSEAMDNIDLISNVLEALK